MWLFGCGDDLTTDAPDAGSAADAGSTADAEPPTDAVVPDSAVMLPDGALPIDASVDASPDAKVRG